MGAWRCSYLYAILVHEWQKYHPKKKNHLMTLPSILIGTLIASLYGALFHLWRGGNLGRLLFYIILSWISFWVGHIAGNAWGWNFLSFGPLRLGTATLSNLIFLWLGDWLSITDSDNK